MRKLTEMSLKLTEKKILNKQQQQQQPTKDKNRDYSNNKELLDLLKSKNIVDGNLVETRRLDLRPEANSLAANKRVNLVYSKKSACETLFANILNHSPKEDEQFFNNIKKKNLPKKCINEVRTQLSSASSTDSESSDEDDGNANSGDSLWIERYRKQKQILNSKMNN
jgi:hypothetical protein